MKGGGGGENPGGGHRGGGGEEGGRGQDLFFPEFSKQKHRLIIQIKRCRDNFPSVQLQTWDLNANLYDGATTAGPVPTLFSDDQQATIDALVADPAQAHKDVVKINRYTNMHSTS